jgi:NADH-quinone oxidoreductase subunit M
MLIKTSKILIILLSLPLLSIILLLFIPTSNKFLLKTTALTASCLIFVISLFLWVSFDSSTGLFQFVNKLYWIPFFNINLT